MKTKRLLKIMLLPLVAGILAITLSGCGPGSESTPVAETQVADVQTGNITTEITAAGNLALSRTEDLPITLFYQGGTVGRGGTIGQVLVEVGDSVKKGQLLVSIDPTEWADQLSALEEQVTAQEQSLYQAQINLRTAQQNLKNAHESENSTKLGLLNAQISLDTARYNLSKAEETYTWPAVETAEAEVERAKSFLQYALDGLRKATSNNADSWQRLADRAEAELAVAEATYDAIVQGYDPEEVAIKKMQAAAAEMSLAAAQESVAGVATNIAINEQQVGLNEGKVAVAVKAVADAREKLAAAQGMSPEITAPFDGFITVINVKAGDNVYNGTIALTMADPDKFEANILVNEMDIMQVKLGGEARVSVNAITGISLPAKVTFISPTASIQSGVVNYQVKVELQPLESAVAALAARVQMTSDNTSRQFQGPPAAGLAPYGNTARQGIASTGPAVPSSSFQLREGLTATVSIMVSQKSNVLVVPNSAITNQGRQAYVQVLSPNGITEQRAIQTGITDYRHTEVLKGLSEGEKVVIPKVTTTTPSTSSSQPRPPGGIFFGR